MAKKQKMRSFASRLTGWIMLTMLATMGVTAYFIYKLGESFAQIEEVSAHSAYVTASAEEIMRVVSDVNVAAVNHMSEIEQNLDRPDRLIDIMHDIVDTNPRIRSCGLSFAANYYPQKGRWFCPYAVRRDSSRIDTFVFGDAQHDYHSASWFREAMEAKAGFWSKPFFDSTDTTATPVVAYLQPIRDRHGRTVAVLGADLSLQLLHESLSRATLEVLRNEWVFGGKDTISFKDYREEKLPYFFLIDADGTYLSHPEEGRILRKNIFEYIQSDTLSTMVVNRMLAGERGYLGDAAEEITTADGEEWIFSDGIMFDGRTSYIFYAPIIQAGWSLGLSVPMNNIDLIGFVVGVVLLFVLALGLIVVYLVSRRPIRRVTKPLKQLAASADEVAKGHFSTELPTIKHNDEIGLLRDSFDDMQRSLSKYVDELTTATASKAAIESELQVAHNIQMGMLPKTFPPYPERDDIDIYGMLRPAKEVGGDLFDFHIHDNHLVFCIGDVSGKGVPASLLMAVTRSLFRNISSYTKEPHHIAAALNDAIAQGNDSCMFVTLFLGVLDLASGHLSYCNAGHDSPLLLGQEASMLPCQPNMPLGVMPGWSFAKQETTLAPATTIFLYTDGLTEAEDASCAQLGIDRVQEVAKSLLGQDSTPRPQDVVERMAEAVRAFVGDADQSDDLTLLAIKYLKDND